MCRLLLSILILQLPVIISGQEISSIFITDSAYYSCSAGFWIKADPACIITSIYNTKTIEQYSPGVKEIRVDEYSDTTCEIYFLYSWAGYIQNESTWRRKFDRDNLRIDFILMNERTNISILPRAIESSGWYMVIPGRDSSRLEYFQECRLDKPGKGFYYKKIRKEGISFLYLLKDFLESECTEY